MKRLGNNFMFRRPDVPPFDHWRRAVLWSRVGGCAGAGACCGSRPAAQAEDAHGDYSPARALVTAPHARFANWHLRWRLDQVTRDRAGHFHVGGHLPQHCVAADREERFAEPKCVRELRVSRGAFKNQPAQCVACPVQLTLLKSWPNIDVYLYRHRQCSRPDAASMSASAWLSQCELSI